MNPILFEDEIVLDGSLLPAEWVGAYCIRPIALPAKGGKAEGSLFLPVECIGAYCMRPLALSAKNEKAKGSLFLIRVG